MSGSLKPAVASVAATVVGLLALECGLRVAGVGAGYWERDLPATVMSDPDLRLRLRPSSRMVSQHSGPIVVSRHGTRGSDFALPKPSGRYRIVAAGDSVTFGWGVAAEEAFPALLGAALADRGVEVVNAGQPSFSSGQGLIYLERDLLGYAPDVVLFCFGHNDAFQTARSDREEAAPGRRRLRRVQALLRRSRIYTALVALLVGGPSGAAPGMRLEAGGTKGVPRATPEEFAHNLRAAASACGRGGARIVLLTQPRRSREPSPYAETVRGVGRELAVPVVDLERAFAPLPSEGLFVDNVHPNAVGHRIFAEEIRGVLERRVELPGGAKP